jgi:hypothetical protein
MCNLHRPKKVTLALIQRPFQEPRACAKTEPLHTRTHFYKKEDCQEAQLYVLLGRKLFKARAKI